MRTKSIAPLRLLARQRTVLVRSAVTRIWVYRKSRERLSGRTQWSKLRAVSPLPETTTHQSDIDPVECIDCGACVSVCPVSANLRARISRRSTPTNLEKSEPWPRSNHLTIDFDNKISASFRSGVFPECFASPSCKASLGRCYPPRSGKRPFDIHHQRDCVNKPR
jgi:ferredoxin